MKKIGMMFVSLVTAAATACVGIDPTATGAQQLVALEDVGAEEDIELDDDVVVTSSVESQGVTITTTRTLLGTEPDGTALVELRTQIAGPRTVGQTCATLDVDAGVVVRIAPAGTSTVESYWNDSVLDDAALAALGDDLSALIASDESAGAGGADEDPGLEINDAAQCGAVVPPGEEPELDTELAFVAFNDKPKVEKGKKAEPGNNQDPCFNELTEYNSALAQFRISAAAVVGTIPLAIGGLPEGIFVVTIGLAVNVEEKRKKLQACCVKTPNSSNCKDVIKF